MSRKLAHGLGLALALTLAPTLAAQPAGASVAGFTGDTKVEIVVSAAGIKITPMVAIVKPGATLQFVVTGMKEGETVELDFHVADVGLGTKGPFEAPSGQVRGRVTLRPGASEASLRYEDKKEFHDRAWKYDIVVRDGSGDRVAKDPMIVGRGL